MEMTHKIRLGSGEYRMDKILYEGEYFEGYLAISEEFIDDYCMTLALSTCLIKYLFFVYLSIHKKHLYLT